MTLKIADINDLPVVLEMGMKFINNTPYSLFANEDTIRSLITRLLYMPMNEAIIILHQDGGMIAGVVTPFLYGPHNIAMEVAWWVNPDKRGNKIGASLIDAFEYWAEVNKCSIVTMSSLDAKIGKYYEKRGYQLRENTYMKEVKSKE